MPTTKKTVLILGGGFGGLRVALDLAKNKNFSVSLVDANWYHTLVPELFGLIYTASDFQKKIDLDKVSGVVKVPFTDILKNEKVNFYCDLVTLVDLKQREVQTVREVFSYDVLVLAMGSTTAYFSIPGAKGYSHPFKTTQDALNVRNDISEEISLKDSLNIVVAGGGFTGVELASSLAVLSDSIHQKYPHKCLNVTVLEGLGNLLTGMPAWTQELVYKKLQKLGVTVLLNSIITEVKKDRIVTDTDVEIVFDYLIWTTGVKGENLSNNIKGVLLTPKGQIETKADLSAKDYSNVFVVGDLAGCNAPSAAWAALAQAKVVSENISRLHSSKQTIPFKLPPAYFIVPITQTYAISNIFNLKVTGVLATLLKRAILLRYLLSILPLDKAIKYFLRGVKILSSNDQD